jgi:hypothetical protein
MSGMILSCRRPGGRGGRYELIKVCSTISLSALGGWRTSEGIGAFPLVMAVEVQRTDCTICNNRIRWMRCYGQMHWDFLGASDYACME